jgi:transaldolase / glucose-6-phosphate isomerase
LRHAVRDKKHVATCLGFGPRFLHSTGQAYKGGPNTGVFLQITCDDAVELPVPGQKYTFGSGEGGAGAGRFPGAGGPRTTGRCEFISGSNLKVGLATLQAAVQKAL